MKNTYLITGGFGFIGSHVIDELLKNSKTKKVINVDKLGIGADITNVSDDKRVENYFVDICLKEQLDTIFEEHKPDYIIHLAAESHVDRSITDPLSFVDSNVKGTANLLECIRKHTPKARTVHVSTDEVYGHLYPDDEPFTENTPLDPRSPYSASKAGSDLLSLSYRNTYKLNIVVTRCCNNYGPRQHSEKLIPTILEKLTRGKKIPIYGNGKNIREWIYVGDHARALVEICHKKNNVPVYNIYGKLRYENLELVEAILREINKLDITPLYDLDLKEFVEFVDDRPGHDLCYKMSSIYGDVDSLKNQTNFADGILNTLDYYLAKYKY